MFEKEAYEYGIASRQFCADVDDFDLVADAFKDGAEFGYNKAKEEAKEIINELLINGYDESARSKALDFLYPDKVEKFKG